MHFTGDTVVNVTNAQNNGNSYGQDIELDTGSSLILDKLELNMNNSEGEGIRVGGGSSLEIKSGSSIDAKGSNALYATGAGASVNLNNTTLNAENGYGVNAQTNANVI